jgi:phosphatidate cytidylyltransferase
MTARILSAVVLVPAVLALVYFATPPYFLVALGILGTLGLREYFGLVRSMDRPGQTWFGYAAYWVLLVGFHVKWFPSIAVLAGVLLAGFVAALWRQGPLRERVFGLMSDLLGALYFALFLYPALPLRFDFGTKGVEWVFILLAVVWIGDTAALVVGKTVGRTLFAPVISPKKTNEGAIGGLVAGVVAAVLFQHFLFVDLPLRHVAQAALLLGIFGQLGDLAESLLKRAAQVKDSSQLIPGHGGVLDRIDSLLFALPVLYLYLLQLYPSP